MANMSSNSSLEALQGAEQRKIMDVVDQLRRGGLAPILKLPQVVVCGDQSSGKSSVLEALTEIPFPRKEHLCTRFATEVVLRQAPYDLITVSITPDKSRSVAEKASLLVFKKTIKDFNRLSVLMDEAGEKMGLRADGFGTGFNRAFARDVLRIEICGPQRPHLTLVDLPGLIHAANNSQTENDVKLIHSLVHDYISNERTIILAVVSAKNDYANQIILEKARGVDPEGKRTLGIITKPDTLTPGGESEKQWLKLARNEDILLALGWHIVKNRADTEHGMSFDDRNRAEKFFLSTGRYNNIDWSMKGVDSLRERLSITLYNHLRQELPGLRRELEALLAQTMDELGKMGQKRSSTSEQRQYLIHISTKAHEFIQAGVDGYYKGAFFGEIMLNDAVDAESNMKRLRAVVVHMNTVFAEQIRLRDHKYAISDTALPKRKAKRSNQPAEQVTFGLGLTLKPGSLPPKPGKDMAVFGDASINNGFQVGTVPEMTRSRMDLATRSPQRDELAEISSFDWPQEMPPADYESIPSPILQSREMALAWVLKILVRTKGSELTGNFNPLLISQLFWDLSSPWEAIATAHVERVADACDQFIRIVLRTVATPEVEDKILSLRVDQALRECLRKAKEELFKLLEDKRSNPMTYNHYYTDNVQQFRMRKYKGMISRAIGDAEAIDHAKALERPQGTRAEAAQEASRRASLVSKDAVMESLLSNAAEVDMDKFSAEEALDCTVAYYKDEMKTFVNNVARQEVERHLIRPLTDDIFSPMVVAGLDDDDVGFLAEEPKDIAKARQQLESRKKMLEEGQKTFRRAMGAR